MTRYDNKTTFTTNLLLDDVRLRLAANNTEKWIVEIEELNDDENRIFYKNIIRLTSVYRVPKDRFSFVISCQSPRTRALAERLRQIGFNDISFAETGDIVSEPSPNYGKCEEVLYCGFKVAGLQYHTKENDEIWNSLKIGSEVLLEHEDDNVYDSNAVAVKVTVTLREKDADVCTLYRLGYVPKSLNEGISALLKAGWSEMLHARVSSIDRDAPYSTRLTVSVYIPVKKSNNIL